MGKFVIEALTRLAAEVAAREGVQLYHLEMVGSTLQVTIDSPAGITLDTCTRYSRALSDELDRLDLIPGRYRLEVSSPGVERRLYRPADYAAAVGKRLVVRTTTETLEGILLRSDEQQIVLAVEQKNRSPVPVRERLETVETTVRFNNIRSARIKLSDAELFGHKESSIRR